MPIHEFRCNRCQRTSSVFLKSISASAAAACPGCGSRDLARCISGFAFHKSTKTIHEEAGEPEMSPANSAYYRDPRNIGRWAEKRLGELGMEMPSQVQEMIAAAREGEMPEPIKDL